jgi:hypothetical protein
MSLSAGDNTPTFPMSVAAFLGDAEKYLDRGDILLTRSPTLSSWIIRKTTASYFSHAAYLFLTPRKSEGFNSTFVLESLYEGVGVANLDSYITGQSPSEIVAVVRFRNPDLSRTFYKNVGGRLLNDVHKRYDFRRALGLAMTILFGIRLGWSRVTKRSPKFDQWKPAKYICSGYIQFGLLDVMARQNGDLQTVIFKAGLKFTDTEELLSTTPEDIAVSNKMKWLFVILNGMVYQVHSYPQAQDIISGGPA